MLIALPLLLLIILIRLACVGAANSPSNRVYNTTPIQTVVYIDQAFSAQEEDDITNAIKSIECSTNNMLQYNIVYDTHYGDYELVDPKSSLFIWKTNSEDERIKENEYLLPKLDDQIKRFIVALFLRGNENQSPVILISIDNIHQWLKPVIVHEALHAAGIGHSNKKESIMYPAIDAGSDIITNYDIGSICDKYHFNPKNMKGCKIK